MGTLGLTESVLTSNFYSDEHINHFAHRKCTVAAACNLSVQILLWYVQKHFNLSVNKWDMASQKIPHAFPMKSFLVFEGLHADV